MAFARSQFKTNTSWSLNAALRMIALASTVAITAWSGSATADAGKSLYSSCQACHGPQGQGSNAQKSPALAGLSQAYLKRQLHNFKLGRRGSSAGDTPGAQMRAISATLGDDQAIAELAAYIATLPPTRPGSAPQGNLRVGNDYYQAKCGACHGGKAQGNALLQAPRLSGQDPDYLKRQYENFATGVRGAHADDRLGRQMAFMASRLSKGELSETQLNDIFAFIYAQDPAAQ